MFYIIERLEGDTALCEDENKNLHSIPLSRLPKGLKEGDVISEKNGIFMPESEERDKRRQRIREKMDRLFE